MASQKPVEVSVVPSSSDQICNVSGVFRDIRQLSITLPASTQARQMSRLQHQHQQEGFRMSGGQMMGNFGNSANFYASNNPHSSNNFYSSNHLSHLSVNSTSNGYFQPYGHQTQHRFNPSTQSSNIINHEMSNRISNSPLTELLKQVESISVGEERAYSRILNKTIPSSIPNNGYNTAYISNNNNVSSNGNYTNKPYHQLSSSLVSSSMALKSPTGIIEVDARRLQHMKMMERLHKSTQQQAQILNNVMGNTSNQTNSHQTHPMTHSHPTNNSHTDNIPSFSRQLLSTNASYNVNNHHNNVSAYMPQQMSYMSQNMSYAQPSTNYVPPTIKYRHLQQANHKNSQISNNNNNNNNTTKSNNTTNNIGNNNININNSNSNTNNLNHQNTNRIHNTAQNKSPQTMNTPSFNGSNSSSDQMAHNRNISDKVIVSSSTSLNPNKKLEGISNYNGFQQQKHFIAPQSNNNNQSPIPNSVFNDNDEQYDQQPSNYSGYSWVNRQSKLDQHMEDYYYQLLQKNIKAQNNTNNISSNNNLNSSNNLNNNNNINSNKNVNSNSNRNINQQHTNRNIKQKNSNITNSISNNSNNNNKFARNNRQRQQQVSQAVKTLTQGINNIY